MNTVSRWVVREDCDVHECLWFTSESLVWVHRVDPWSWASFSLKMFLVSGVSCMLGWPGPSDEQSWKEASIGRIEKMSTLDMKLSTHWNLKTFPFKTFYVCRNITDWWYMDTVALLVAAVYWTLWSIIFNNINSLTPPLVQKSHWLGSREQAGLSQFNPNDLDIGVLTYIPL